MEKRELIGKGMTAEVYTWGPDKVLKLFFSKFGDERINYEAEMGYKLHEAGVPSPAVYDVIEVDGRKGIVFQRILGKSLLKNIEAEPWKLYYYTQQLAGLQYKIHKHSASSLPTQKERFAFTIGRSSRILGDRKKRILDYLASLPDGVSVCHGDIHFNNVIVSGNDLVAIDWNSAYQGNPLGDVARTCLMLRSPSVPTGIPESMAMPFQYTKRLIYSTYVNEYMMLSKVTLEDIDAWVLPVAAAKIKDKVPGEEKWLLNIINKRLKQLEAKPALK